MGLIYNCTIIFVQGFIFLNADSGAALIMNGLVGGLILSVIVWLIHKSKIKNAEKTYQNDLKNAELNLTINPNDINSLFLTAKENYKRVIAKRPSSNLINA